MITFKDYITENHYKAAVIETSVFDVKAYHGKCMEPNCSWESKRVSKPEQAHKLIKQHHEKEHFPKEARKNVVNEANKYDYEWDEDKVGYHVTKNGNRVPDAFYKAKSLTSRSDADTAAKKHARRLDSEERSNAMKQREHDYQMNKPLSEIEKRWIDLHKKLHLAANKKGPMMTDDELKKYSSYGSVVRSSILNGTHPILKEEFLSEEDHYNKNLSAADLHKHHKAIANAIFKHPYYQKYAKKIWVGPTAHKIMKHPDITGNYIVQASCDGKDMAQFRVGSRGQVWSADHFQNNGEKHLDGRKMWLWKKSFEDE
jgi:hypothetical protein